MAEEHHVQMHLRLARLENLLGVQHDEAGLHLPAWLRQTKGEHRLPVTLALAVLAVPGKKLLDFLFTQMTAPELVSRDWEPAFVDYLYLSFTNATAFSPTDTLPLSRWAKLTMMLQSTISLVTVALVVARAVNIFS